MLSRFSWAEKSRGLTRPAVFPSASPAGPEKYAAKVEKVGRARQRVKLSLHTKKRVGDNGINIHYRRSPA